MSTRPIIFSTPMVLALLEGRKTQTRRVLKPQPKMFDVAPGVPCKVDLCWDGDDGRGRIWKGDDKAGVLTSQTVPYAKGALLWVRETHRLVDCECTEACRIPGNVWYEADCSGYDNCRHNRLRPSIHMPRWASRLTLRVTDVRLQRLLDISECDALAEGFAPGPIGDPMPETPIGDGWTVSSPGGWASAAGHFQVLWQKLHPEWDGFSSPWVVAITFDVIRENVDRVIAQPSEAAA